MSPPPATPRYELGDEIARGGQGVVFAARDTLLGRDVAVKALREGVPPGSHAAHRFLDEARITAQLQHPGIPPVHDLGTLADGRPFLAMKLIKGRTLAALLAAGADAGSKPELIPAFEQLCQAVAFAHAHGVVHRDLKPANVMVGAFGEVQVMDWGLAKVVGHRLDAATAADGTTTAPLTDVRSIRGADDATRAGSMIGTPAFMAPEQAIGAVDQIDARTDVFGLGAILCVVLTGKPPYVGGDAESTRQLAARAKLDDAFGRLAGCGADPDLVALCRRCLAPEKADRPADAGVVADAVAALRAAADDRARQADLDRVKAEGERARAEAEAREQRKRRRVQLALAAAVGLLALGGGAFGWWQERQATARRTEADNRDRDERERRARTAGVVAELLDQCAAALRADDTDRAAILLHQAEARAADGGAEELTDRLARCRIDLAVLRDLDVLDHMQWASSNVDLKSIVAAVGPGVRDTSGAFRAAFGRLGAVPGEVLPEEVARRMAASTIRERLIGGLDLWLQALVFESVPWRTVLPDSSGYQFPTRVDAADPVLAVLRVADPDPYRNEIRAESLKTGGGRFGALVRLPDAEVQPPWFVPVMANPYFGRGDDESLRWSRGLLVAAHRRSPGNLRVIAALSNLAGYTTGAWGNAEALTWAEAAVAARPGSAMAHHTLGWGLLRNDDPGGAAAEYREAIRIAPHVGLFHESLAKALGKTGDPRGAVAENREALRLDPTLTHLRFMIGNDLLEAGEVDAAVAEWRDAARAETRPQVRYLLAHSLLRAGDLDGAIDVCRQTVRSGKRSVQVEQMLAEAERVREVLAGRAEPAAPAELDQSARAWAAPLYRRFAQAARLYERAFAADPDLASDLVVQRRYNAACYAARAARGDGVDAPPDPESRAALRRQALAWLRAELSLRRARAGSWNVADRQEAARVLAHWLADPDLAGVRHPFFLTALPAGEAAAWRALWADVRAARDEAQRPPPPPTVAPPPRDVKRPGAPGDAGCASRAANR